MPLVSITLRPGINRQITPTLNEGGFSDGDRVRFPYGVPEAIGGWQKAYPSKINGICRGLHAWSTLLNERLLSVGTHLGLYIGKGGVLYDITPATFTPGTSNVIGGTGYGVGPYGKGGYGTARIPLTTFGFYATDWSLDNWGEELVGAPRGGPIYNWKPVSGVTTKATEIPGAPASTKSLLVGMPERHLIALGAEVSGRLDPMLVRWSDVEDYTSWTASALNSAGSFSLQDGSEIISAQRSAQQILIWTDTSLISMRFIGLPFVYSFNTLGTNCGLCGPRAANVLNGTAFWRGRRSFYLYNGAVQTIPCDVYDECFVDVNEAQIGKTWCGVNSQFGEVTWFFPSKGSAENDKYATFSTNPRLSEGQRWTVGDIPRTAWLDADIFAAPIAASPDGYLYYHETGQTADGAPLNSFVETGVFDIGDGDSIPFLDQIIPDFEGTQIAITIKAQNYPGISVRTKGPFLVTPTTRYLSPRLRGRQISLRFDCTHINGFWRGGKNRVRLEEDGKR
jgi:hypothetical protein